jgi:hypothetical protein
MKYYLFGKTIFILLSVVTFCMAKDWLDIIKYELEKMKTTEPSETGRLVEGIQTDGYYDLDSFKLSELEEVLTEKEFTEELKNKIRGLIWANSVTFQGFHFSLMTGIANLYEMAGVARKIRNKVDLFYFASTSYANLRPQMEKVSVKICSSFLGLFDFNCSWVDKYIPRPFTIQEINSISDALRSNAYYSIYDTINSRTNLLFISDEVSVSARKKIPKKSFLDNISHKRDEAINQIIYTYKDDEFIRQLPLNANDFIKAIQVEHFYSIHEKNLDRFFETFVNNIKLGIPEDHVTELGNYLKSLDSSKISEISSLFFFLTNKDKTLDLYNVFLTYEKDENRFCITVKKIQTKISIDANILISKLNDGEMNALINQGKEKKYVGNQFTPMMTLFNVVCQNI